MINYAVELLEAIRVAVATDDFKTAEQKTKEFNFVLGTIVAHYNLTTYLAERNNENTTDSN